MLHLQRTLKESLKRGLQRAGYRVSRLRPENRFDAMADTLALLHRLGYEPDVIIDAGANQGNWTRIAANVFPEAHIHMIEPQPACQPALTALLRQNAKLALYPFAVTRPGVTKVRMSGLGADGSGAWVLGDGEKANEFIECGASTLDQLLEDRITAGQRCLLKLDMEGHEFQALQGAGHLLSMVEVILTEVRFFKSEQAPLFRDILCMLHSASFDLFDVAALAPRARDGRLRSGDAVFVRKNSLLAADTSWI